MSLKPVIIICGTTGVGKSRLAIELAQSLSKSLFNPASTATLRSSSHASGTGNAARIINADAMQVYAGLDILTNKVPVSEQGGVEHLLMSFKRPGEQYVVGEWVRDARILIKEAHERESVPIIVGGTAYWIQHLLFPSSLPSEGFPTQKQESSSRPHAERTASPELSASLTALPSTLLDLFRNLPSTAPSATSEPDLAFSLHALLSALDPPMGSRWHWKDTRKVLRNLQIISEHNRRASDVIQAKQETSLSARYRALFFWLYCDPSILDTRLDNRIDQMLESGLIDEIRTLHQIKKDSTDDKDSASTADYTSGIYQSIGYREFDSYLVSEDPSPQIFVNATEDMKRSTRQYAKRQIKWFKNKFLPVASDANRRARSLIEDEEANGVLEDVIHTYVLDATDLGERWTSRVLDNAREITEAFLTSGPLPDPSGLSPAAEIMLQIPEKPTNPSEVFASRQKQVCQTCTTDLSRPIMIEVGPEWGKHVRSKGHRRALRESENRSYVKRDRNAASEVAKTGEELTNGDITEDDKKALLGTVGFEFSHTNPDSNCPLRTEDPGLGPGLGAQMRGRRRSGVFHFDDDAEVQRKREERRRRREGSQSSSSSLNS